MTTKRQFIRKDIVGHQCSFLFFVCVCFQSRRASSRKPSTMWFASYPPCASAVARTRAASVGQSASFLSFAGCRVARWAPRVVPYIHAVSLQVVRIFSLSTGDQSSMIHVSFPSYIFPSPIIIFLFFLVECGKSATRISRIVGGSDASFGQFPWQVSQNEHWRAIVGFRFSY